MFKKCLFFLLFVSSVAAAQETRPFGDTSVHGLDSIANADLKENILDNIPEVIIDENEANSNANNQASISPLLFNSRDPFFAASSFSFSAARFRFRGYTNDFNTTYMNGLNMQTLENGATPFAQWGGLNYVLRNRQATFGITPANFGYGNIGSAVNIDTRASRQRKQTQLGYGFTTRGYYTHRVSFSKSTGLSKKGWAFTFAGTFRGSNEGFIQGTYGNAYSYFLGVDKKISERHLLSFVGFGAPTETGLAGGSFREVQELTGNKFYNPNWGLQNGQKRNSRVARTNQPVFILTHDYKIDKKSSLVTAVGYTFGKRSVTAIDFYNTADPRPDYYRYLPSYYPEDPALQEEISEAYRSDINLQQINWDNFYEANRNNFETINNVNGVAGNNVSGLRSRYIVENRVTDTRRASARTVFNSKIGKRIDFSFGMAHQTETNNYYREVEDLLGGQFYVDLNQFAERDFPTNTNAGQNDLNNPNRILKKGDRYSYDYDITVNKSSAWTQGILRFKKVDFFAATELSNTQFWRVGYTRHGLFPNNSFGKSKEYSFNNYSVKAGINLKLTPRNYFYLEAVQMTRAPFNRNVFISPRTRDLVQDNLKNEKIRSIEGGYLVTTPFIKMRISGYYTKIEDEMSLRTFYHDVFRNFVNYGLNDIDRVHFGGEMGFESRAIRNVIITGAASVGRFYYSGRPNVIVTQDNSSELLAKSVIYQENYRVGRTPQEAYTLGVQYRSPNYWSIGTNVNYFDQIWIDINPIRRTVDVVQGIPYKSPLWNEVLGQERVPGQTTVDAFISYSWRLPMSVGLRRKAFLFLNANVNNVLNNENFIVGGSEQLRYDNVDNNVNKFPARYFYAFGRTFSLTASIRF